MKERREAYDGVVRRRGVARTDRVLEDVEPMVASLLYADALGELGKDARKQRRVAQEPHPVRGLLAREELGELVAHALGGDRADALGTVARRAQRRLVDFELELRRETNRAHHPQRVLAESLGGIPDSAHDAPADVILSAVGVEEDVPVRVEGHRVHGEVPAPQVFVDIADEVYAVGAARVGVVGLGAVGGHLETLPLVQYRDRAVLGAGGDDPAKGAHDLLGRGVRGEVKVGRLLPEDQVSHGAADEVALEAVLVERAHERRNGAGEARAHGCDAGPVHGCIIAEAKKKTQPGGWVWRSAERRSGVRRPGAVAYCRNATAVAAGPTAESGSPARASPSTTAEGSGS